jgi:Holliday junction DNA helicase RuvA
MISYLKGTILEKGLTYVILENNGIGYKVFVTPEIMEASVGGQLAVYTYHKVSEDGQALFGVPDFATLQFFEMLITVSGVGPKMALAILSSAKADTIKQAIANQDASVFTRISGVGTKTAERIILELKNKVGALDIVAGVSGSSDVYDALLSLGYKAQEIREALKRVNVTLPQQEQLKEALKILGRQ